MKKGLDQATLKSQLQSSIELDHPHIALLWATGSGKTGGALKVIDHSNEDWFCLTNEIFNIESIQTEMSTRGYSHLLDRIDFLCHASLHHVPTDRPINIWIDEAHLCLSELKLSLLEKLIVKRSIITTATLKPSELSKIKTAIKADSFYTSKATVKKNIKNNLLPTPIIETIPAAIEDKQYSRALTAGGQTHHVTGRVTQKWDLFRKVKGLKGGYRITLVGTFSEVLSSIESDIGYYKEQLYRVDNENLKKRNLLMLKRLGLDRAGLFADVKMAELKKQYQSSLDNNERFIVFAANLTCANELSSNVISSHKTKEENKAMLESFKQRELNDLVVYKMLTTGQNFYGLTSVIFHHLEKSEVKFIQKVGRGLREENTKLRFIYVKDTKDEDNVFNFLKML